MPAGKRPRSTPLLGSEGKQLNLESRKSDSIDYATLSVMKGRVQEESESLHHTCETEYFKAIRWRNNFVNVMLKKGLEKGDVVKAREPIGNEYIPEKSGDANGQRGKNLNEKEYMHHCNEVVLHRPSERGLDQKMEMSCSDVRTVIQSEISFSVSRPSTPPLLEISNKRKLNPKYIASSSVQAVDVDKNKSVKTSKRKINAKKSGVDG